MSRYKNLGTQAFKESKVFNNPKVVTEGWYPVGASKKLKKGKTQTYKILEHQLVIFRGFDGEVRALDAFCPHMGAELSNGRVVKNRLQCFFHHWEFSGDGHLAQVPCMKNLPVGVVLNSYPVEEKYGFIWVYSGVTATHPVPQPPTLEEEQVSSLYLRRGRLFAHHHVLMASGIDLNHFASVHNLDIDFKFEAVETEPNCFVWNLEGVLPTTGVKARIGRFLMGDKFRYSVKFSGGSVTSITYGVAQKWKGRGFNLPSFHILWGGTPLQSGVSDVDIFLVTKKFRGFFGGFKTLFLKVMTLFLLTVLKDEDVKAFPGIRFQAGHLIKGDESVARLIQMLHNLPISKWTGNGLTETVGESSCRSDKQH
ncbi:MAG: aromatic ring-hydroxylating dioxygenase subunit alpha [Halobacteriovoraceae bacterium]|jgi:nitrite reductase/ring-hydroxylating ferredoxin subunit|nr:aromatic ring-hydroxylating dioxygenase subunit alpha [Halobacteriovoraceae bacterium]MBT5092954.1 aromatic ring-hydroxylating dioxygenase subunit alpha [Halobacteriovoraceae bacterium]